MKFKKQLVADTDGEPVSPKVLLDNLGDTHKSIHSLSTSKKTNKGKTSYQSMGNYLISIFQPGDGRSSNASMLKQESSHFSSFTQRKRTPRDATQNSISVKDDEYMERERRLQRQMTRLKQEADSKKKNSCRLLFEKNNILQGIVQAQKISNLKKNFIKKIRRSSPYYPPVDYKITEQEGNRILDYKGFQVQPIVDNIINLISVVQIISLLIIYSISFVFQDLLSGDYSIIEGIQMTSFFFYFGQIVKNLVTVKFSAGKRIQIIRDIINHYIHQDFWVDLVSFIIILIDMASQRQFITFFRMFIIFKLPQCLNKIEKLEVYFIRNVYNEQYWELAKVFLVNFCYAHIIAIFLGAMAGMNPANNWLLNKGLIGSPWVERYVWSVYWATNIMLTVGFGDIAAANYQEAICLIFIETLSCIIMAYNINRVGSIITNIRREDQNRSKKFKIFKKLSDQNTVSEQLQFKINNYIEESSKIKKRFNYEEDQQFLKELPDNLRTTYLKEANKEILNKLVFFKSLLDRTLCNFSQVLQTKISHPQEVIRALQDDFNLIILRKGHIGYACKKNGCGFNDAIADQIRVRSGDLPFLTSLDFISKTRPQYEIKSLQFSVLFTMEYEKFIKIFRKSDMDYELFCFLRDKCRNIPDEFQVKPCQFCKEFSHFKFSCPRLHYMPYQQHVINKEIYKTNKGKNHRRMFQRSRQFFTLTPMEYYKKIKGYRDNMIRGRTGQITQQIQQNNLLQETIAQLKMTSSLPSKRPRTMTTIDKLREQRIREVIEEQLLKREKGNNFEDDIWDINLDVMANFNGYFSKDNPKQLADKFSKESRMAQKKIRFKAGLEDYPQKDQVDEMVNAYQLQNLTDFYGEISGNE